MMNDREKSDPLVVATTKSANNGGQPSAEPMERRGGAEGNAHQSSTFRTPSRGGVTAGLARIRTTATSQSGVRVDLIADPEAETRESVKRLINTHRGREQSRADVGL
jgi:hypothetical protein